MGKQIARIYPKKPSLVPKFTLKGMIKMIKDSPADKSKFFGSHSTSSTF